MPGRPLLLVDAPSLLYRAWFALPDSITDAENRPVNALLGTTNMLLRVVEEREPRAVMLCFGPDAALYRVALYAGYHADRPPIPDGLEPQFERAVAFFDAFGWSSHVEDEYEADDLLGSYARAEEEAGGLALILTGDRDMFQCASEAVTILYVRTGASGVEDVDPEEVMRRYGVPPALVPDFIALRGDPSDGLPGAPGIGAKTAAALLKEHGSIEAAIAGWARVRPPRAAGALRDGREELERFKRIATLQAIAVERPPDRRTDRSGGAAAARRAGMNQLAARLEGA